MTDQAGPAYADRLAALAADGRFDGRADDLRALAEDLRRDDGDRWAGVDLYAAFPTDSTLRLVHPNWVERFLGVLAGVSVFLPVAWTWWGFHSASRAYRNLLQAGSEPEGSTFLGLWATGFEGRLEGLHLLVPMGGISVSLILLAIACIVLHRLAAGVNVRREEAAAQAAHGELLTALTGAQLVLNARRADHPQRIEGIIKSSMEKLREAHEATRGAVGELSSTSERLATDMGSLLDSVKKAGKEARKLVESATAAGATLQDAAVQTESAVTTSLATLDNSVRSTVAHAEQSLTASARDLSEALRSALTRFETTLGGHLDGFTAEAVAALRNAGAELAGTLGRAGAQLHGAVGQIGDSAQRNAAAAGELSAQVGAMTDESALTRSEIIAAITDFRESVEGIESALTRHESALQGQASELTGARDAAERMLRTLTLVNSGNDPLAGVTSAGA